MITKNTIRNKHRIWITWETQRRSIELSKKVGAKLFLYDIKGKMRYPISIAKTIFTLMRERPHILFVQNPSMILATIACVYGLISNTHIVVDRHTTFRLNKPHTGSFKIWLFMRLHYFTLKYADITIVTNDFLANLVKKSNGRPVVLPDILPVLIPTELYELKGDRSILLISSFGLDEPIQDVLEAMDRIGKDIYLYITGNYKKRDPDLNEKIPSNVKLTGFIPDQTFVNMLFSVDAVLVLTTSDFCMLCGCYEAIAANKPLITSDKFVLKQYFTDALFVNNSSEDISHKIKELIDNLDTFKEKISQMKSRIESNWEKMYKKLEVVLNNFH